MGLSDLVITGPTILPPRGVIHGGEKVGKTTFASQAPGAIFIPTEDGADQVGVARFPKTETLKEVQENLRMLVKEDHDYQTVVIDSGDWLENLIHAQVAADAGVASIGAIGYGKGYVAAEQEWRKILAALDVLRNKRGMASLVICHTQIQRFDSPEVEPYDRYTLKTHKSSAALLTEWADFVGFAAIETFTKQTEVGFNQKVTRGMTTGKRVLRLQGTPAYVAGNRYSLPASVPLSWADFEGAFTKATEQHAAQ